VKEVARSKKLGEKQSTYTSVVKCLMEKKGDGQEIHTLGYSTVSRDVLVRRDEREGGELGTTGNLGRSDADGRRRHLSNRTSNASCLVELWVPRP